MGIAICILGMHRSGTSAVTKGIQALGAYLGEESNLMPPHISNPKGFWEHLDIVRLQEAALQAMGLTWDTVTPILGSWFDEHNLDTIRDSLSDLVSKEFGDFNFWAWKDPRTCLFLPLWQNIFPQQGIDPKYLIVIRNPLDVAESLSVRDGLSQDKSLAMWLNYTLSALVNTENKDRMIIDYDDYLTSWEQNIKAVSSTFDIPWPEDEMLLHKEMNSFLTHTLQHSRSNEDDVDRSTVSSQVKSLYKLCMAAKTNNNLLQDTEFNMKVRALWNEYIVFFNMFSSGQKYFSIGCAYANNQSRSIAKVTKTGPIDDQFHEYILEIPHSTGSELLITPLNFDGLFEIQDIRVRKSISSQDTFEDVYHCSNNQISQLPSTNVATVDYPNGTYKFLATKNHPQFWIQTLSMDGTEEYSVRIVMKVFRENHPIHTQALRQGLSSTVEKLNTSV